MWIKWGLIVVPVSLLLFLAQSYFWAPDNEDVANDPSRLNRLIYYIDATPENMNTWQSTSATDSTISQYLNEALLDYDPNYEIEPKLARQATVNHEIVILVPKGISVKDFDAAISAEFGRRTDSGKPDDGLVESIDAVEFKLKESEIWNKISDDPALAALKEVVEGARFRKVVLMPTPVQGKIASAVEPKFREKLEARLGQKFYAALELKDLKPEDLARLKPAFPDLEKAEEVTEKLKEHLKSIGITAVQHSPVVDFHIHKGVYWTDGPFWGDEEKKNYPKRFGDEEGPWWGRGPEFSARDVKITIDLLKDEDFASPRRSSWLRVKEVRTFKKDKYHLQVVYTELYSPALTNLLGGLLPYHHWNNEAWTKEAIRKGKGPEDVGVPADKFKASRYLVAKERDYSRKPASLGPMVLEPLNGDELPLWQNGMLVRLRRNEFYWDRKPEFEFLDYYIFDPNMGQETAELVFQSGGIDLYGAKPHQVERYEAQTDKYYVMKRRTTTYAYLGFNTTRKPMGDFRVRKALAMALDVDEIIKYIVWGQGERISGPGYPVLRWYDKDYRIKHTWLSDGHDKNGNVIKRKGKTELFKYLPYDLDESRALLALADYDVSSGIPMKDGRPLKVTITLSTGNTQRKDIALLAQEQWQRLGISVEIQEHEWNVFLSRYVLPMNFQVCVLGWSGGLGFDKRQLWHTDSKSPKGLNFVGFSNIEVDRMMEDLLKIYDVDEQKKFYDRIFGLIADDLPYIFLYSTKSTTVVDRRVIWRKKLPGGELVDRPMDHRDIVNASAAFTRWTTEFLRGKELREFAPAERRD